MVRRILCATIALFLANSAALAQSSAGNSVGTGAITLAGSLPAFAATPTFNIGTIGAIATDASVQAIKTALGSPFQAGGSIGNTAFGISGTLPAFAATPTVNLGTLNGAATDAAVQALRTALGSPLQAGGSVSVSNLPATQAVSVAALPLPSNAATAANQSAEIAQLTAANQRTAVFSDAGPGNVGAGTPLNGPVHDAGASPSAYTKFNASFASTTSSTAIVQASNDNSTFVEVYSAVIPAPLSGATYNSVYVSMPVTSRYYKTKIITGSSSANVFVNSSYSTN